MGDFVARDSGDPQDKNRYRGAFRLNNDVAALFEWEGKARFVKWDFCATTRMPDQVAGDE